MIVLNRG